MELSKLLTRAPIMIGLVIRWAWRLRGTGVAYVHNYIILHITCITERKKKKGTGRKTLNAWGISLLYMDSIMVFTLFTKIYLHVYCWETGRRWCRRASGPPEPRATPSLPVEIRLLEHFILNVNDVRKCLTSRQALAQVLPWVSFIY